MKIGQHILIIKYLTRHQTVFIASLITTDLSRGNKRSLDEIVISATQLVANSSFHLLSNLGVKIEPLKICFKK